MSQRSIHDTDRHAEQIAAGGEAELSEEEVAAQFGTELPDRLAMSPIYADVTVPADPVIVADVLSGALPVEPGDSHG